MAKELPYFRFTPQEWQNGDISLERLEIRGLFIDVCCYYWINDCSIAREKLEKRYINALGLLNELISLDIILWDETTDFIKINFLDEQFDVLSTKRKRRQEAGRKGGKQKSSNAKAKLKQSSSYKDKDKDKDKDNNYELEREVLKQVYHLFDEKYYSSDKQKKDWLDTIRKCLEIDKRPKQQIIDVITFARNDDFWQSNLLTINALRKKNKDGVMKYDSILAKMPKKSKFTKATYQQLLEEYKHEGIASEKFNSGEYHIINGKIRRVLTDSKGMYIRDINTENGTVTKLRL